MGSVIKRKITAIQKIISVKSYRMDCKIPQNIDSEFSVLNNLEYYTEYILNNVFIKRNRIFGSDLMKDVFCLHFGSCVRDIQRFCNIIYNEPNRFYDIHENEEYYEGFLKYLWVDVNGVEFRLVDIANITNTETSFLSSLSQKDYDLALNNSIDYRKVKEFNEICGI